MSEHMDEQVRRLVETLEEIAVALNDWFAERKVGHEVRAEGYRRRQDASWGTNTPWVYAAEMIRRDDAEHLKPIRRLMRLADKALDPFQSKTEAPRA